MLLGEGEAGTERETSCGETVPETSADDASSSSPSPPDNASPSSSIKNGSGASGSTKTIGGGLASMGSEVGGVVWRGVGKSEVSALSKGGWASMGNSTVDDCSGAWKLLETVLALSILSRSGSE